MEDPSPGLLAAVVASLILASGFFSLFEQALAAARKTGFLKEADDAERRAQARRKGSVGRAREARRAERFRRVMDAAESPGRHLAVARFWACALRVLASALAGLGAALFLASLAPAPADPARLVARVFSEPLAWHVAAASVAAMVAAILALDRVARSAARHAPERIAAALIAPVGAFALPLLPFFFLARRFAGWLRGVFPPKADREGMTEDELRRALIEGEKSGVVESKERAMVEGVFYLGDRPLGAFMTHRSEVQWLDAGAPPEEARAKALESKSQRCFPVADGSLDAIVGAAYREDIILDMASPSPGGLRSIMRKATFAPETMPALKAFESLRGGEADCLFVMDEYGGFAGMVSAWSLVGKIVGELASSAEKEEKARLMEDGSWVASGGLGIDEAERALSLPGLSGSGDYRTLAGLVLSLAGELPRAGDAFGYRGYRFTVLEMDGNRIDSVAIAKAPGEEG